MGTQANVLTPQQMRCIYALARGGGISNDDLHAVVFATTGKDSIKLLTSADAKQVIDRLKRLTAQQADEGAGGENLRAGREAGLG